jgi:hypothetical protein
MVVHHQVVPQCPVLLLTELLSEEEMEGLVEGLEMEGLVEVAVGQYAVLMDQEEQALQDKGMTEEQQEQVSEEVTVTLQELVLAAEVQVVKVLMDP